MGSHLAEVFDIAVANSLSVLILIGLTFFVRQFEYSRLVFLYFWVLNLAALSFSRMVFREGLRFFRKQGYNQRHCLIVGAGKLGQRIAHSLSLHPEFGVKVQGYLTRQPQKLGQTFEGVSVIGLYGDLEKYTPALDIVFLCLPPEAEPQAEKMLGYLATMTVEVKSFRRSTSLLPFGRKQKCSRGCRLLRCRALPCMDGTLSSSVAPI